MQTMHKAFVSLLGPALALGVWFVPVASAQDAGSGMTTVVPGDQQWQKTRPCLMACGSCISTVIRPSRALRVQIRVPTGYKIPPVKYPDGSLTTILKGIMWNAEGERYDPMKMQELGAGNVRHPGQRAALPVGGDRVDPPDRRLRPGRQSGDLINPDDDPRTQ